ncbi:uncharacterized protein RCO7_03915 [Rhynchosporium graminicola]|uniref:Uncharacterized protein n=1 Tax=Rhynchosporium graminicola TaxID=2792576 RepID=A0A1E1L5D6_9HELO|nr:uncharacterized protein RCO7_03915 [Rhynchosporium commune]
MSLDNFYEYQLIQSSSGEPTPIPKPHEWKGHPQPPPDERLQAARFFLADEDPDRCIDFASRIAEIKEYVEFLETEIRTGSLTCDQDLLRDIKAKLAVHRDWEQRRKDGIPDLGCDQKPWQLPYSIRSSATQMPARSNPIRTRDGRPSQMRDDHPPFSVRREADHSAFIAALKKDSTGDPDEVDIETNLIWSESRAYGWALREPVLIPSWMHPTEGIPRKGVSLADTTPWYRKGNVVDLTDGEKTRPARGWIPGYLVAREQRINSLLSDVELSDKDMEELEDLLNFVAPLELQRLRAQNLAYEKDDALGLITEEEDEERRWASVEYAIRQEKWMSNFTSVYFILKSSRPEALKSEQPGIFYVDHGVMDPERQATLDRANSLLSQMYAVNVDLERLSQQDLAEIEVYLQFSQPITVTNHGRRRAAILRQAKANGREDVNDVDKKRYDAIYREESLERKQWLQSIASNSPQFRYLRPGEMAVVPGTQEKTEVLYIPWNISSVPTMATPILLESALPPSVLKFQALLQLTLVSVEENNENDDISRGMREFLQIVYPDLRTLGAHWQKYRTLLDNSPIRPEELRLKLILDPIFERKFRNWRYGLLDRERTITMKMPRPGQDDERPGILYSPNLTNDHNAEDQRAIQILLDLGDNRGPNKTRDLQNALIKYQYPALRRLHDEYLSTIAGSKYDGPRKRRWTESMNRWIRTLEGSWVEIRMPSSSTLPANDPCTVYYREPVQPSSYPFMMTADQATGLQNHLGSNQPIEDFKPIGNMPLNIQKAYERYRDTKREEDAILYAVHLDAWYLSSQYAFSSRTETIDPSIEEIDSSASGESDFELSSTNSTTASQENDSYLGVDLSLMLPQIRNLENEINHIARIRRTEKSDRALILRFSNLLQQFIPSRIQDEYIWIAQQREQLGDRPTPGDKKDLDIQSEQLTAAHNSWIREITEYGVSIRVSPGSSFAERKTRLDFNPRITGSGVDFHITGPAGATLLTATQSRAARLVQHTIPAEVPNAHRFTKADKLVILEFERSINSLLVEQEEGTLSWDDSESLLSKLRVILPTTLQEREREHAAIDKKAREIPLSQEQDAEFWESWERWNATSRNWISTIPDGRVIIATGDAGQDPAKTIHLNTSNMKDLQRMPTPRPKTLPHPVKTIVRNVNDYLFGDFAALSTTERHKRDTILWQLFRPIYAHLRRHLNAHIREVYITGDLKIAMTEVNALNDSISLRCCALYRDMLRSLTEVTIEESVPGEYILAHESIIGLDDADIMSDMTENEKIAGMLFKTYCEAMFTRQRREFLMITTKIRNRIPLTRDEDSKLLHNLANVAKANLKEIHLASDLATKLAIEATEAGGLTKKKQTALLRADGLCTWYRWVLRRLPQGIRVSMSPEALRTMVDTLLKLRIQSPQEVDPVLVEPPSVSEIQELQAVLNNLLMQEKMELSTPEMGKALDFLLGELLSPSLKTLKSRIDLQEAGFLDLSSNSLANIIGFLEAQKGVLTRFQSFKKELQSRFGIVLDSWWFSEPVIFAACAGWKLWKSTNQNEDGTPKLTVSTTKLENDYQQEQFGIYALLTDWVLNGCSEDVPSETSLRLILKVIPDLGFDALQTQIRDTTAVIQASRDTKDPTNAVFLLGIKEELIKSYMEWYSSQPRSVLENLRKQYIGTGISVIDFSGKAERRGIQRAAIEISLNLLASNQEQHRPADRFRVVDLTRAHVPLEKEIPISLPLEPSRREVERDAFEFTKKMIAYKDWKDFDYEVSRNKLLADPPDTSYGILLRGADETRSYAILDPPTNFNGPFALAQYADAIEIAGRRQAELSRIALRLQSAYTSYPRPLLERLLSLISQGMDATRHTDHNLYDEVALTREGLAILEHISGDSWDEIAVDDLVSSVFPDAELALLDSFEADIRSIEGIPLWSPQVDSDEGIADTRYSNLTQIRYSPDVPSQNGVTLDSLTLAFQKLKGKTTYVQDDMRQLLFQLKSEGRIHCDDVDGEVFVSWIPYSGHPENKYVTSREEALVLPYVRRTPENHLAVRYDAQGAYGPPIVQPNKYEHFQRLAFRLGRDTLRTLQTLENPQLRTDQTFSDQLNAGNLAADIMKEVTSEERGESTHIPAVNLGDINVINIAREVCSAAPHLAMELGIEVPYRNAYSVEPVEEAKLNTTQAADLIQLKILEELSNNFEPKMPVNETVWDFAEERLANTTEIVSGRRKIFKKQQTKFFSVRRYPICCQTQATKEAIRQSGPVMQVEPAPEPVLTNQQQVEKDLKDDEEAAAESARGPLKTARHIRGQRPHYPFGETPYQEAYQSHVMESELRGVEGFGPPQPTGVLASFNRGLKRFFRTEDAEVEDVLVEPELPEDPSIPNDPYPLPRLPVGWKPANISAEEKRLRLIEGAKQTPGFPDPAIPEYYHTQEEIEVARARAETSRRMTEIAANDAEVALSFKKNKSEVPLDDWRQRQIERGINPYTGLKFPVAKPKAEKRQDKPQDKSSNIASTGQGQPSNIRRTNVPRPGSGTQAQDEGKPETSMHGQMRPPPPPGSRPSSQRGRPGTPIPTAPLIADKEGAVAAGVAAQTDITAAQEAAPSSSEAELELVRLRKQVAELEAEKKRRQIMKDAAKMRQSMIDAAMSLQKKIMFDNGGDGGGDDDGDDEGMEDVYFT